MIYLQTTNARLEEPHILWDNLLLNGTVTASTEQEGGEAGNAYDGSTADFWIPDALPATLTLDLASAAPVRALGVAAHTLASAGCTIIVEHEVSAAWVVLATVTPTSNDAFMVFFDWTENTDLRIRITGGATMPAIGFLMLGTTTIIPEGVDLPHTPLHLVEESELLPGLSRKGQFLRNRVVRQGGRTTIKFIVQKPEDIEDHIEPFIAHYNLGEPFFFATAPDTFPRDMGLCWRAEGASTIEPSYRDPVFMMFDMQVRVYRG